MTIYLYVKQCSHCSLKYFGKTEKSNPYKYKGSGLIWQAHIKKYNAQIKTIHLWKFDTIDKCTPFAIKFCKDHNVIESTDWANLILETGKGMHPDSLSPEHKYKLATAHNSGRYTKGQVSPRKGVKVSKDARNKMSKAKLGKKRGPHSPEHKTKLSAAHKARRNPT